MYWLFFILVILGAHREMKLPQKKMTVFCKSYHDMIDKFPGRCKSRCSGEYVCGRSEPIGRELNQDSTPC